MSCPTKETGTESNLSKIGANSIALQDTLRASASTNGSELHAFQVYRLLLDAAQDSGHDLSGEILELGGYDHPGLHLLLLLAGAKKVHINNVVQVQNLLPWKYAQNIYFLTQMYLLSHRKLSDVVEEIPNDTAFRNVRIKPELINIIGDQKAEEVTLPDNSVDFIFSMAVLEHVRDLPGVCRNSFRILNPGGWGFHIIDLRDHLNFLEPLEFLKISKDEFRGEKTERGNQLRSADYITAFRTAGFEISRESFACPFDLNPEGTTDMLEMGLKDVSELFLVGIDKVKPWVTSIVKKQLHPDFQHYSRRELSVTGVSVTVLKE